MAETVASDREVDTRLEEPELEELGGRLAALRRRQAIREVGEHQFNVYFGFNSSDLTFTATEALADVVSSEVPGGSERADRHGIRGYTGYGGIQL